MIGATYILKTEGRAMLTMVEATPVALTLNPGTTYVVVLDITECAPYANQDHIMLFTVIGGGSTYEELQYGSAPTVGDVVV